MKKTKNMLNLLLVAGLLAAVLVAAGCASNNSDNEQNSTNNTVNNTNNTQNLSDSKVYVSRSPEECTLIKFMCAEGKRPFFDEIGCGCQNEKDSVPEQFACTQRPQACTREYNPVCGQVQVQCIRAPCPPINQTFGNACDACANQNTISYTMGACEEQ